MAREAFVHTDDYTNDGGGALGAGADDCTALQKWLEDISDNKAPGILRPNRIYRVSKNGTNIYCLDSGFDMVIYGQGSMIWLMNAHVLDDMHSGGNR